jgi:tRNA nucleotidyltransferase/poly(A) polymerase
MREFAVETVKRLRDAGFESLWAGGCVRDQLLGKTPKDYDVATSASPDQVREVFGRRRTIPVGAAFGVITLVGPPDVGNLDVATFRQDGGYTDGRRPDAVTFGTAELDAQRRDFTINGLFFDPIAEQVIDYVGGQADLKAGVLRAIGDAHQRFAEDKLRMLRAVRFTAALHFQFDAATRNAVEEHARDILLVSAERIAAEMRRMLSHGSRADAVTLLREVGLLEAILPEAAAMERDNWAAMLATLQAYQGDSFSCALAIILRFSEEGASHGSLLAKKLGERWRLSTEETELVTDSIAIEKTLLDADNLPWPRVQRKLIHPEAKQIVEYAKALAVALGLSNTGLRFCEERLAWPAEKLNPKPLVTGDDLVRLGLKPGREFKSVLEKIRDLQLEERVASKEEALREFGLSK